MSGRNTAPETLRVEALYKSTTFTFDYLRLVLSSLVLLTDAHYRTFRVASDKLNYHPCGVLLFDASTIARSESHGDIFH